MSRIVLATPSVDLKDRVAKATNGAFLPLLGPLPADPAHVFAHLDHLSPPKVVVLDACVEPEAALQLAARFDAECPAISVILVSEPAPEFSVAAMRAGVRDIVPPASDVEDPAPGPPAVPGEGPSIDVSPGVVQADTVICNSIISAS